MLVQSRITCCSPSSLINPPTRPRKRAECSVHIYVPCPRCVAAGIVLFRPLSLEHGLGLAVAHLLFPILPHRPTIVMPDHGRRTEPEFPALLPCSPTNIHVVTSLPKLRIKSIDGLQPAPAESHVTAGNVLCFAIGKEHMGRTSRRVDDTIRSISVIRDWYVRALDACVILFDAGPATRRENSNPMARRMLPHTRFV